jgi:HEAT repeat protein
LALENDLIDLNDIGEPPWHADLVQLSGLSTDEVAGFRSSWASLNEDRKCEILTRLAQLSEDNLELDFTAVLRACLTDGNETVREQATRGLWECEDRVVIRPLVGLLTKDPAAEVRSAAAITLGKFAEMARDGKLLERDGSRILEALLTVVDRDDEYLEVRRRAIEAVACFNVPVVEELITEAYNDGATELKQSAIFAMGRTSNAQWLPTVLNDIDDIDAAIRFEAANACGLLGDESTIPHLLDLIDDEDFRVQTSAVQALGSIGGPLARRALLQCLKLGDESLGDVAQEALSSIESDEDPMGF